jgi:hypothetical protein
MSVLFLGVIGKDVLVGPEGGVKNQLAWLSRG